MEGGRRSVFRIAGFCGRRLLEKTSSNKTINYNFPRI
jgi:hypothetical protein